MEVSNLVTALVILAVLLTGLMLWHYAAWFRNSLSVFWSWLKTEVGSIGPIKKLLLILFGIFSFVVIIWFINKMSKPIEANTKPAVKSVVKTVIGSGYAVTEGWDEEKARHKQETGDYIPSKIGGDIVRTTAEDNTRVCRKITITMKSGYTSGPIILNPKAGGLTFVTAGRDVYLSKTPGCPNPDFVINDNKGMMSIPFSDKTEWYLSMQPEFTLHGDSVHIIDIYLTDKRK